MNMYYLGLSLIHIFFQQRETVILYMLNNVFRYGAIIQRIVDIFASAVSYTHLDVYKRQQGAGLAP